MQETAQEFIRIVSVKFRNAGKHYDFNAQGLELPPGTRVVVETDRGRALGVIAGPARDIPRLEAPEDLKSILRLASDEDIAMSAANASKEKEAFRFCMRRIQERKMEMKLVRAEYLFDSSKIIFYFTADGRIDFRELVKDLAHYFHTRIEMRQIGVRDEAKLTGGLGICGRELCCCTFLTDFTPVSVKMAKEQGLALNPNKISGQCGRLLCCLSYEFETYCSLKKNLPKCGRKVHLCGKEAEVIDQNVLAQTVTVTFEDGQKKEVTVDEVEKGVFAVPPPSDLPPSSPRRESRGDQRTAKPRPPRPQKPRSPEPVAARLPQEPSPVPSPPAPPVRGEEQQDGAPREGRKRNRNRRRPRRN